jgi:hypothetical protein
MNVDYTGKTIHLEFDIEKIKTLEIEEKEKEKLPNPYPQKYFVEGDDGEYLYLKTTPIKDEILWPLPKKFLPKEFITLGYVRIQEIPKKSVGGGVEKPTKELVVKRLEMIIKKLPQIKNKNKKFWIEILKKVSAKKGGMVGEEEYDEGYNTDDTEEAEPGQHHHLGPPPEELIAAHQETLQHQEDLIPQSVINLIGQLRHTWNSFRFEADPEYNPDPLPPDTTNADLMDHIIGTVFLLVWRLMNETINDRPDLRNDYRNYVLEFFILFCMLVLWGAWDRIIGDQSGHSSQIRRYINLIWMRWTPRVARALLNFMLNPLERAQRFRELVAAMIIDDVFLVGLTGGRRNKMTRKKRGGRRKKKTRKKRGGRRKKKTRKKRGGAAENIGQPNFETLRNYYRTNPNALYNVVTVNINSKPPMTILTKSPFLLKERDDTLGMTTYPVAKPSTKKNLKYTNLFTIWPEDSIYAEGNVFFYKPYRHTVNDAGDVIGRHYIGDRYLVRFTEGDEGTKEEAFAAIQLGIKDKDGSGYDPRKTSKQKGGRNKKKRKKKTRKKKGGMKIGDKVKKEWNMDIIDKKTNKLTGEKGTKMFFGYIIGTRKNKSFFQVRWIGEDEPTEHTKNELIKVYAQENQADIPDRKEIDKTNPRYSEQPIAHLDLPFIGNKTSSQKLNETLKRSFPTKEEAKTFISKKSRKVGGKKRRKKKTRKKKHRKKN